MRLLSGPGVASLLALALALLASGAPVDTLRDLGPALTACFRAPPGSAGSEITVLLSLTSDGAVLGRPRITHSHLAGPPASGQAFVRAVLASLDACTPVSVTPGLGGAIAGRPLTLRFLGAGAPLAI